MDKNRLRQQRRQQRLAKRRTQRTVLILVVVVVIGILAALVYFANQGKQSVEDVEMGASAVTTDSGLRYEDLVVGSGAEAKAGDLVSVQYTGWLLDGTEFDTSKDDGIPFEFTIDNREVIPGWDEGVAGMKVGGKRKLAIPPDLGYGSQGAGSIIPPNAVLVFEVELVEIK